MKKTFRRFVSLALALVMAMSLAVSASAAEVTFDLLVDYGNDPTTVSASSITKTSYTTNVVNYGSTKTYICTAPVTITSAEKNYCGLFELNTNVASHMPCEFTDNLWAVNGTHVITEPGSYILVDEPLMGAPIKMTAVLVVKEGSGVPAEPATPGLQNFKKVNTYKVGQYSDVPASHTFSENAKAAYEFDIMQGYGTTFGVSKNITRLASIIIACRLNCIYYNGVNNIDATYSGTTQQRYLAYAKDNGILCDFDDVSQNATRAEFAAILASAFPAEALPAINTVEDNAIPDVGMGVKYADDIYMLYRGGILNGSDAKGTFYPASYINRGAACAIATRMCDTALRKSVNLTAVSSEEVKEAALEVLTEALVAAVCLEVSMETATEALENGNDRALLEEAFLSWELGVETFREAAALCGDYAQLREAKALLLEIADTMEASYNDAYDVTDDALWEDLAEGIMKVFPDKAEKVFELLGEVAGE